MAEAKKGHHHSHTSDKKPLKSVTEALSTKVYLQSAENKLYVSSELSSDLRLRARAEVADAWESYSLISLGGNKVAFKADNGKYVSAELNYIGDQKGMLRARSDSIGDWEIFEYIQLDEGCFALKASNGLYVSAELDFTGDSYARLRARASIIAAWEKFI